MARVNWADLFAVIIILRSTYVGSQRGFFGELFHIFGICIAIVLSIHFYASVSYFFNKYVFLPSNFANIAGFLLIAGLIYLLIRTAYALIGKVIKLQVFPAIDRVGGSLLGFCRGFTLSVFLFFIMLLTPIHYISDSAKTRSAFAPFFVNAGVTLYEKTIGLLTEAKREDLQKILAGAKPVKFSGFGFKRRDKLDDMLR